MFNYSREMSRRFEQKRILNLPDVFSFGAGFLCFAYLNMGGNVYLAEIFLLTMLPYLLYTRGKFLRFGPARLIIILSLGWFVNQVITDLYRGTSPSDIVKGWALIAVFITNFLGLYLLVYSNPRRVALGLFGYSIGLILQVVLQPNGNMLVDAWKFGVGGPITILLCVSGVFLYHNNPRKMLLWSIVLILISVYSFYVRSRSLGGSTLLTVAVMWFRYTPIGRRLARRIDTPVNVALGGLLLLFAAWGVFQVYGYAAGQGYLGETARNMYFAQAFGDYGILLGGRREWLPAVHAILDSPFIGFGSYARNTDYGQFLYDLNSLGYVVNNNQIDAYLISRNTIPTHSHLLQGWVWAGIIGGIFWIYILTLAMRSLVTAFRYPNSFFMVTVFLSFSAMWAILFSPLSNIGRLQWAFILTTFLYTLSRNPESTVDDRDAYSFRPVN
jgi:hypothetical protein